MKDLLNKQRNQLCMMKKVDKNYFNLKLIVLIDQEVV